MKSLPASLALLIASALLFLGCAKKQETQSSADYPTQLKALYYSMQIGTETSIRAAGGNLQTWYSAIEARQDPSTYLSSATEHHRKLKENADKISGEFRKLSNPPQVYSAAYYKLLDLHTIFREAVSLTEASGSLNSYAAKVNDVMERYKRVNSELSIFIR